jgi:hypothetical protein
MIGKKIRKPDRAIKYSKTGEFFIFFFTNTILDPLLICLFFRILNYICQPALSLSLCLYNLTRLLQNNMATFVKTAQYVSMDAAHGSQGSDNDYDMFLAPKVKMNHKIESNKVSGAGGGGGDNKVSKETHNKIDADNDMAYDYKTRYAVEIKSCVDILTHYHNDKKAVKTKNYTNDEFDSHQTLFERLCNQRMIYVKARSLEEANVLLYICRKIVDESWCTFYTEIYPEDKDKEKRNTKTPKDMMRFIQDISNNQSEWTVELESQNDDEDRIERYGLAKRITHETLLKMIKKI